MPWWAWLLFLLIFLMTLTGLILLLPLRIFVRYVRENKKDHISLRVRLGVLPFLELWNKDSGEGSSAWHLKAGRLRIPAALWQKALPGQANWNSILDMLKAAVVLAVCRQCRSLLKKITLSRFDLELSWGWDDPALTGLAAGGCWAVGGMIAGLLQEYFSVAARPRLQLLPLFRPAELRLRWEGEVKLSLYCCFRLWVMAKKIGGVPGGSSSH